MVESNPYDPPHTEVTARSHKRYEKPRDLWLGLSGVAAGVLALAFQVMLWGMLGAVFWFLLGGGVGLLAVGAMRLWAYLSDRSYSQQVAE